MSPSPRKQTKTKHEIPVRYNVPISVSSVSPKSDFSEISPFDKVREGRQEVQIERSVPKSSPHEMPLSSQEVPIERSVPNFPPYEIQKSGHEVPIERSAPNFPPYEAQKSRQEVPIERSVPNFPPYEAQKSRQEVPIERSVPNFSPYEVPKPTNEVPIERTVPHFPPYEVPKPSQEVPIEHTIPLTIQTSASPESKFYGTDKEDTRSHDSGITSRGSSWQSENFKAQGGNFSPGSYSTLPVRKTQQPVRVQENDYNDAEFNSYSTLPNIKPLRTQRGYETDTEYVTKKLDTKPKWMPQRSHQPISEGYATDIGTFRVRDNRNLGKETKTVPETKQTQQKPMERDFMSDLNSITQELLSGVDAYFESKGKSPSSSKSQKKDEHDNNPSLQRSVSSEHTHVFQKPSDLEVETKQ